ncbi:TOBE domain-containing protein [Azospira inquinata]|uniref:TOBE domain-containing protein n=1 Tax=Azospira inquinata TaxID=2785627 RepID=A0A975XVS1_9RHOO|nr:TOBE domain-containing protein [Azospira inquinata]QWT47226.1 TOBE domain-containing protein [Azospira inquinata]QWT50146.1 TOBE domain-containing protein [Azospira inquinata]
MKASARNLFSGKVTAIRPGAINAEVELTTAGGDKITAIVTQTSVQTLELAVGKEAIALIKAPWVMLLTEDGDIKLSARNRASGKVSKLVKGAVNTEVAVTLAGGSTVYAIITNDAVLELGLAEGRDATVLFKASHVILGVPA